ncbi:MAG TPA: carboxylating nicotinate-nucleotide diphosphorylase [Gemmatimonadaceae bacterium]|nr:carboxylating nicotinate-nucleotide diphosphorylase [Gemmatimonadaceae bacterium]
MTTPTPNPSPSGDSFRAPRTVTPMSMPALNYDRLRFPLTHDQLSSLVRSALEEDQAFNDVTTIATVLSSRRARASLVARQSGCIAGVSLALEAFRLLDPKISMRVDAEDGTRVEKGGTVLYMTGHARGLLSAERTALNFMQRLSGIASLTAKFVDAVKGTKAKILDTRKTTPGWRRLEKYAVRAGGGVNHRLDLARAVLIKDNHLRAVDGDVGVAVRRVRELAPPGAKVEVECDSLDQVRAAIDAGADEVLVDNMGLDLIREAVAMAKGRVQVEASGGVTLDSVRGIAETGVDFISVGALTHSPPAMNLALDFD